MRVGHRARSVAAAVGRARVHADLGVARARGDRRRCSRCSAARSSSRPSRRTRCCGVYHRGAIRKRVPAMAKAQRRMRADDLDALDLKRLVSSEHQPRRASRERPARARRAARAFASGTTTATSTSRAWPASGARRSAMATRSSQIAAAEQIRTLSFTHLFAGKSHEPAIRLADKLVGMAPFPASKVFFGNSGSDANDTQVKLVWYYNNAIGKPKKKKIIARQKAYHGVTVASAGLTGTADVPQELRRAAAVRAAHGRAVLLSRRRGRRVRGCVRHAAREQSRAADPARGAGHRRARSSRSRSWASAACCCRRTRISRRSKRS